MKKLKRLEEREALKLNQEHQRKESKYILKLNFLIKLKLVFAKLLAKGFELKEKDDKLFLKKKIKNDIKDFSLMQKYGRKYNKRFLKYSFYLDGLIFIIKEKEKKIHVLRFRHLLDKSLFQITIKKLHSQLKTN